MRNEAQLQELYAHLNHNVMGDIFIAWYGQLRATEMGHAEALAATVERFHLAREPWYQARGLRLGWPTA
jgi:hypothetical protein